jgi:hypothetical protein
MGIARVCQFAFICSLGEDAAEGLKSTSNKHSCERLWEGSIESKRQTTMLLVAVGFFDVPPDTSTLEVRNHQMLVKIVCKD